MGDNWVYVRNTAGSNNSEVETTGTNLRGYSQELIGYYTDKEGLDVHKFADADEKQKWIEENHVWTADGQSETFGLDVNGDADTTYKYNFDIKTDEAGKISEIVVAVYSDESKFGYIYDEKFTNQTVTPDLSGIISSGTDTNTDSSSANNDTTGDATPTGDDTPASDGE